MRLDPSVLAALFVGDRLVLVVGNVRNLGIPLRPRDGERNALALHVDVQDLDLHDVAELHSLVGTRNAAVSKLAHRNQAIEARLDLHEGTEIRELDDLALDVRSLCIALRLVEPRIAHRVLDGKRDTLRLGIEVLHIDVDLIADGKNVGRLLHAMPCEIRDMRKSVYAADVDEGAVLDETLDRTAYDLPDFKLREDLFLLLLALFLQEAARRRWKDP